MMQFSGLNVESFLEQMATLRMRDALDQRTALESHTSKQVKSQITTEVLPTIEKL